MNFQHQTYQQAFNQKLPKVNPVIYENNVIQAPVKNQFGGFIEKRLLIDSKDRNIRTYPNNANYRINLNDNFTDIIEIELTQGIIPLSDYLISERNNKIYLSEDTNLEQEICIDLSIGNYLDSSNLPSLEILGNSIEEQLNSTGNGNNYTLTFDKNLEVFTIESDLSTGVFGLNFYKNPCLPDNANLLQIERDGNNINYRESSIGRILGYAPANYLYGQGFVNLQNGSNIVQGVQTKFLTDYNIGDPIRFPNDSVRYTITAINSNTNLELDSNVSQTLTNSLYFYFKHIGTYRASLYVDNYLLLNIRDLEKTDGTNSNLMNNYVVLPYDKNDYLKGSLRIDQCNLSRTDQTKYFNPPLGKLDNLELTFRYPTGQLYNFRGINHLLDFKIINLNVNRKYKY